MGGGTGTIDERIDFKEGSIKKQHGALALTFGNYFSTFEDIEKLDEIILPFIFYRTINDNTKAKKTLVGGLKLKRRYFADNFHGNGETIFSRKEYQQIREHYQD
ncbi:hypothetical protein CL617_02650 [archaeon]|nr:hypothetical protein [archaeon]|tara:strand:+ start:169 stop:480 length:312 start_codon:yes stop_codon:yes gene_type:complete